MDSAGKEMDETDAVRVVLAAAGAAMILWSGDSDLHVIGGGLVILCGGGFLINLIVWWGGRKA